jgi:signal transduction histidine kinase
MAMMVVAMFAFAVNGLYQRRRDDAELILAGNRVSAQLLAEGQEAFIAGVKDLLLVISKSDAVRSSNPAECSAFLREVESNFTKIRNVGLIEPPGLVRCSALPFSSALNLSDRQYFREAVQTGEFTRGEFLLGRITGEWTMNFAMPVYNESSHLFGVLFVAVAPHELFDTSALGTFPQGSSFTALTSNGTVFWRVPDNERWVGQNMSNVDAIAAALRLQQGSFRSVGVDGVERLYGVASIENGPRDGFVVLVGVPVHLAFVAAQDQFRTNIFLLFAFTLLVGLLGFVYSEAFIVREERRRSNEQRQRIDRIQEGDAAHVLLASKIAHELASPLTPVKIQVKLLGESNLPARERERVGIIERNIAQVQRLISDLSDVFKLDAGRLAVHKSAHGLAEIVLVAVKSYTALARSKGIDLQTNRLEHIEANVDRDRITQVLYNFLSNAIKFSPHGSRVTISLESDGEFAVVRVDDEGPGIQEAQRERLFRPFSQLADEEQVRSLGTGLGLYISRGLIEAHGGVIGVSGRQEGTGSSFWFRIPAVSANSPAKPALDPSASGAAKAP